MRGRDPPDEFRVCRRLIYDPREWKIDKPSSFLVASELGEIDRERISRMKADELDRLVASGEIREIDRERVRFIIRTIVYPPERPDYPLPENAVEGVRSLTLR